MRFAAADEPARTIAELWKEREDELSTPLAVLVACDVDDPTVAAVPRRQAIDPLTILRWLARPADRHGPRLLGLEAPGGGRLVEHHGVDEHGRVRVVLPPGAEPGVLAGTGAALQ